MKQNKEIMLKDDVKILAEYFISKIETSITYDFLQMENNIELKRSINYQKSKEQLYNVLQKYITTFVLETGHKIKDK